MEGSLVAYKVFSNGSVLNASEINDNLMRQSVMVFSNAAARSAAITVPVEGMLTYLEDVNRYESYNGSIWESFTGLTQIVSQTIGSGVTSVTVNNAFSSLFDNYKIMISTVTNANSSLRLQLSGSTGSTYSTTGFYMTTGSTTLTGESVTGQTSGAIGVTRSNRLSLSVEVYNPFVTLNTQFMSQALNPDFYNLRATNDSSTASSTGFNISPGSGTMTGGTISVYGYKKG
jgi:hypothetical protein